MVHNFIEATSIRSCLCVDKLLSWNAYQNTSSIMFGQILIMSQHHFIGKNNASQSNTITNIYTECTIRNSFRWLKAANNTFIPSAVNQPTIMEMHASIPGFQGFGSLERCLCTCHTGQD